MSRPLRIGLLAEGKTELGRSVEKAAIPEYGGTVIEQADEGVLHMLIRRELAAVDITECQFIYRHPTPKEERSLRYKTGYSILAPKFLKRVVARWGTMEVDMVIIVVDADDTRSERQQAIATALKTISQHHFDEQGRPVADRNAGGVAIPHIEAWLLADSERVESILQIPPLGLDDNLENFPSRGFGSPKTILERAISQSPHMADVQGKGTRKLQFGRALAEQLDTAKLKTRCPAGYKPLMAAVCEVGQRIHQGLQ